MRSRTGYKGWRLWLSLILLLASATLAINLWITSPIQPQAPMKVKAATKTVKFDFYTVLPKMQVSVPEPSYVLQVASLQQLADAESLRDSLRASGYPAVIQPFTLNRATWYRIMVGPFYTMEAAQQKQLQLKNHQINGVLLKMPTH